MAVISMIPDSWVAVAGVDFGLEGAFSVCITARSEVNSRIEILTDSADGNQVVILDVPSCEKETEFTAILPESLTGVHDLYFRFSESGTSLLEWQFQ